MKAKQTDSVPQPQPFTPGITRGMVREHAFRLYLDRLSEHKVNLTLEDWILAEKDLAATMETEASSGMPQH